VVRNREGESVPTATSSTAGAASARVRRYASAGSNSGLDGGAPRNDSSGVAASSSVAVAETPTTTATVRAWATVRRMVTSSFAAAARAMSGTGACVRGMGFSLDE